MHSSPFPTSSALGVAGFLSLCALLVHGLLIWMGTPVGTFLDWVLAIAGFWWLLGVVTVPWNMYFGAREVRNELIESGTRGIATSELDLKTVNSIAKRAMVFALVIHVATAAGFAALSVFEITSLGWAGCGIALALTGARPLARFYAYTMALLARTSQRVRFPADDVRAVKDRLATVESLITALDRTQEGSWAFTVDREQERIGHDLRGLSLKLERSMEENEHAHRTIVRDAERIGEKVSEDIQFLGHVREMIQFLKNA